MRAVACWMLPAVRGGYPGPPPSQIEIADRVARTPAVRQRRCVVKSDISGNGASKMNRSRRAGRLRRNLTGAVVGSLRADDRFRRPLDREARDRVGDEGIMRRDDDGRSLRRERDREPVEWPDESDSDDGIVLL